MGAQFDTLQELQKQYNQPLAFEPFPKDTGVQRAFDASLKQFSRQIDAASGPATRADRLMQSKSIPAKIGGGLLTALAALNPDFLRLREQKRSEQFERQTFLEREMLRLEMERAKNQYNLQLIEFQTRNAALEADRDNRRLALGEIGAEEARRRDGKREQNKIKSQQEQDLMTRKLEANSLQMSLFESGGGMARAGGARGGGTGGGLDVSSSKIIDLLVGSSSMAQPRTREEAEALLRDVGGIQSTLMGGAGQGLTDPRMQKLVEDRIRILLPDDPQYAEREITSLRKLFEQRTAPEPPPDEDALAKQRKEELERQRMQALVDSLKQGTPGGYQIPRETGTALDWIQSLGKFAPPGIVPNLIGNVLSSPGYQKFVEPVMAPYVTGHPSEGPTTMQRVLEFERRNQPPPEGLTRFLPPSSGGQSILRR